VQEILDPLRIHKLPSRLELSRPDPRIYPSIPGTVLYGMAEFTCNQAFEESSILL
jgi:hypothetical protein